MNPDYLEALDFHVSNPLLDHCSFCQLMLAFPSSLVHTMQYNCQLQGIENSMIMY